MRLKSIKLAGFKSFVDPTSIPFPGEMTAILGPNGCGKSNVIDAVRWVLGESSAKNLRGDAMTDVIFNGSSARKPVSQCSVELVFDNTSGRIGGEYAAYSELSVKRIVTQDATSSYQLNGSKCRRRDITDLFLGTGLGPRSYAIIEQGMISKLIESKPQELRVFIEEAAGVSKYKERRRETENRIKHTKENLERLSDVRVSLDEQISKLKRQAAAATRYKELKAQERELKAQLATYRWLKQSDLIAQADSRIKQKEVELEELISRQRGDEGAIIRLRTQQADEKQHISDLQQSLFKIGTDITKIEQSQLFSQKRKQQIQQETQLLQAQLQELNENAIETSNEIESLQSHINDSEPARMMAQEALLEAKETREAAEQAWREFSEKLSEQETQYHSLKQGVQNLHGQVENTAQMQMRTQSRIAELLQEQAELEDTNSELELEQSKQAIEQAKSELEKSTEQLSREKAELTIVEASLLNTQSETQSVQNQLLKCQTQLDTLLMLQTYEPTDIDKKLHAHAIDVESLVEYLAVEPGYETIFEVVVPALASTKCLSANSLDALPSAYFDQQDGSHLLFRSTFSSTPNEASIAKFLRNTSFPAGFNHILFARNLDEAKSILPTLALHQTVITQQGIWLSAQGVVNGAQQSKEAKADGYLARANQISVLEQQIKELNQQLLLRQEEQHHAERAVKEVSKQVEQKLDNLANAKEEQAKANAYYSQAKHNAQAKQTRRNKLADEISQQELIQAEEQEKLSMLDDELAERAMELELLSEQKAELDMRKTDMQTQLESARAVVERLMQEQHQLDMQAQQLQSHFHRLQEKQDSYQQNVLDLSDKLELLQEESIELAMPLSEQDALLQALLEQKEQVLQQQQSAEQKLADIEQAMTEAEMGQQGVNVAAEKIKTEIESERIQLEGAKVRAQSFLAQLDDMSQAIKPILDSLPDDIDEKEWQQTLEKTTASLQRLGAVNLAAVEEYEIQAERKQHLDTQYFDLSDALDTLESAIRKIDKETRTRFKATFEQVNSDLKMLFPKVFGGGSAYLALTDDDLLDTGVTIMARPPGKKNSTIHLLSGGEKALTALSLVFAIFRLNPAPFCLLDEVDAPLDDANVGRFCKLVSEMSKSVQFIYITHNKVAMEMATHLTGVTMAEPGVSRIVAVDVEEALAIAE